MTEKELNAIYYLNREIRRIQKRIDELQSGGLAPWERYGRNTRVSNPTEQFVVNRMELLEQLQRTIQERIEAEKRVRAYIDGVTDAEIREIMTLRFVYQKSWADIAAELSPLDRDIARTTYARKLRRYLQDGGRKPRQAEEDLFEQVKMI